jgi:PST family polysaccharide transporter
MTRATGTGVRRSLFAMLTWQIGNYLVPLATFPYLTRVLGPEQFGVLGYATAIAVYGTVLTEWGFNLSGPKAVVERRGEPQALNALVWSTMAAKACLCALSFAALLVALQAFPRLAGMRMALLLAWVAVAGNVFTLNWLLQGLERFWLFTAVSLLGRFCTLPLTFLLVKTPADTPLAIGLQAAASVLTGCLSLGMAMRLGVLRRPAISWRAVRQRLAQGADMFAATACVTLFGTTNTVILGSVAGAYEAGLYSAADKLKTVANMLPAQINTVLYPRIATLFGSQRHSAARMTWRGAAATVAATAAGVAVTGVVAQPLTRLVLGPGYDGAGTVLQWLCVATLFGNLAYFLGLQVLVNFGAARWRAWVMFGAGLANVALAFALVPHFGAAGAAGAFLIAEAATLALYLLVIAARKEMRAYLLQPEPQCAQP